MNQTMPGQKISLLQQQQHQYQRQQNATARQTRKDTVNLLIQLHSDEEKFDLDILDLAIDIVDKYYLSKISDDHGVFKSAKNKALLVITSLWIAVKYQGGNQLTIKSIVANNGYTIKDAVAMELDILSRLSWSIGTISAWAIAQEMLFTGNDHHLQITYPPTIYYLTRYLIEATIAHHHSQRFCKRILAASAVTLAVNRILPHHLRSQGDLIAMTSYRISSVFECCTEMIRSVNEVNNVVHPKYSVPKWNSVSLLDFRSWIVVEMY